MEIIRSIDGSINGGVVVAAGWGRVALNILPSPVWLRCRQAHGKGGGAWGWPPSASAWLRFARHEQCLPIHHP